MSYDDRSIGRKDELMSWRVMRCDAMRSMLVLCEAIYVRGVVAAVVVLMLALALFGD